MALFHPIPLLQNLTDALKQVDIDEALFLREMRWHFWPFWSVWAESKIDLKKKHYYYHQWVSGETS